MNPEEHPKIKTSQKALLGMTNVRKKIQVDLNKGSPEKRQSLGAKLVEMNSNLFSR